MTAQLEKLDGLNRQLSITVSADEIGKAYSKRVQDFSRNAKLKGFRPGKVPVSVVEQKFGQGILQETAAHLIESSLQAALQAQNIRMAGLPTVDFKHETVKQGESFHYVAKFEVYPEFQLKDLTDTEVESPSAEVTEDDINAMLIQLRTQHSEWLAIDARAAKLGDRVKIDFDGVLDGKPMENGSAKGHILELGSKSMIPGFEDGVIGMKKGETKVIEIAFPAEYHVEALRSKPVAFTITLHDIEEPKLPELNDEFAKKMGVKDGLETLKKNVRERMENELKENTRVLLKQNVLDKLMAQNVIDVPASLIDSEISHLQDMTRQQMRQYLGKDAKIDVSKFPLSRDPYVENAKKRVVLGLLLAEAIKQHQIQLDQAQVQVRLREMAAQYGDPQQILPMLLQNKRMVSDVEAFVLEEQAIDALLKTARVQDVKKSYDAVMSALKANQQ
ncbi:MAG: trigger factor [Coxiellaceae bacterium]|nr:trigger factor [Coxiellaceae bacterium]